MLAIKPGSHTSHVQILQVLASYEELRHPDLANTQLANRSETELARQFPVVPRVVARRCRHFVCVTDMAANRRKKKLAQLLLLRIARTKARAISETNKRRWWVRPILQGRNTKGHFSSLIQELKQRDREWYYR